MSQGPIHHGDRRGLSVRGMQCGDAGPNVFLSKARLCLDFPLSESPSSRRFLISPEKAVRSDGQALSGAAQKEASLGRDSPRTCTTLWGAAGQRGGRSKGPPLGAPRGNGRPVAPTPKCCSALPRAVPGPWRARPPAASRERPPSEPGVPPLNQPVASFPDSVGKGHAAFAGGS